MHRKIIAKVVRNVKIKNLGGELEGPVFWELRGPIFEISTSEIWISGVASIIRPDKIYYKYCIDNIKS